MTSQVVIDVVKDGSKNEVIFALDGHWMVVKGGHKSSEGRKKILEI